MENKCTWPQGVCQHSAQEKPEDRLGRVWMHSNSGLALTKASMSRLIMFVLENDIEIGDLYPFAKSKGALVCGSFRLRDDQVEAFELATGGKLNPPMKVNLNRGWCDD